LGLDFSTLTKDEYRVIRAVVASYMTGSVTEGDIVIISAEGSASATVGLNAVDQVVSTTVVFAVKIVLDNTAYMTATALKDAMLAALTTVVNDGTFLSVLKSISSKFSTVTFATDSLTFESLTTEAIVVKTTDKLVSLGFNTPSLLASLPASSTASPFVRFSYSSSSTDACSRWGTFKQRALVLPEESLVFSEIRLHYGFETKDGKVDGKEFFCRTPLIANSLSEHLSKSSPVSLSLKCNGSTWTVFYSEALRSSTMCVNCFGLSKTSYYYPTTAIMRPCAPVFASDPAFYAIVDFYIAELDLAPTLQVFNMVPNSTYIRISGQLSRQGRVYCRAFGVGVTPSAVVEIKQTGPFTVTLAAPYKVELELTGLTPETDYDIYCSTEDFEKHVMLIDTVLETVYQNTTICCRTIGLTSTFPSIVSYSSSNLGTEKSFRFLLDSKPLGPVTVTVSTAVVPCANDAFVSSNSITALPSSFTFKAGSLSLAGSFVLRGAVGCYSVTVSSTGVTTYTSAGSEVVVYSATAEPPVPKMVSAIYSNAGNSIVMAFDENTDRGKQSIGAARFSTFKCNLLFTFLHASICDCAWVDSKSVKATLRTPAGLSPLKVGDSVVLGVSKTRAACTASNAADCDAYKYSLTKTVLVQRPISPITPVVFLFSSSLVSKCSAITIDSTSSYGRGNARWKTASWTVQSTDINDEDNLQEVSTFLNSLDYNTNGVITIPNVKLVNGTYNILLTLTNQFSLYGVASTTVTVGEDTTVPRLSVVGPSFLYRSRDLIVYASAEVPSCVPGVLTSARLEYVWTLFKDGVLLNSVQSASLNPRFFKLGAYTLDVNSRYTLRATVTTVNGVTASEVLKFNVGRQSVLARLAGGNIATISEESLLSLDASGSYDMDYPPTQSSAVAPIFTYTWECVETAPTFGDACNFTSIPDTATISLPMENLIGVTDFSITVYVTSSVSTDTVVNMASVQKTIIRNPGPPLPLITLSPFQVKYNSVSRILLSCTIDTYASSVAVWSGVDGGGRDLNMSQLALTSPEKVLSAGETNFQFTLRANVLTPGLTYTFTVTSNYFENDGKDAVPGSSSDSFLVNSPPSASDAATSLVVSPSVGVSLVTPFRFSASTWSDDVDDYPLTYAYAYYTSDPDVVATVRGFAEQSYFSDGKLSAGTSSMDYNVTTLVYVSDIYGGMSSTDVIVVVVPDTNSSTTALQDLINDNLVAAFESDDPDAVAQSLSAGSSAINAAGTCDDAPDCDALNRLGCEFTTNTCGTCNSGYDIGQFGDANSICLMFATASDILFYYGEDGYSNGGSPRDTLPARALSMHSHDLPEGIRELLESPKLCPVDCSGNGECVAFNESSRVGQCLIGDSACRVACDCSIGWNGADCSITDEELVVLIGTRELMCSALRNSTYIQDVEGESAIVSRMLIVSGLLRDISQISDLAYEDCMYVLTTTVISYPEYAAKDAAISTVISTLSYSLEFANVPDPIRAAVSECLELLGLSRQNGLSNGEMGTEIVSANLRFMTVVEYLGDLSKDIPFSMPRSGLEKALNTKLSGVGFGRGSKNDGSTTAGAGVSMWSGTEDTSGGGVSMTSPVVYMKVTAIGTGDLTSDQFEVTLVNDALLDYSLSSAPEVSDYCDVSSDTLPYTINITCPNEIVPVECPGNSAGPITLQCPLSEPEPQCIMWDRQLKVYAVNPFCNVTNYTASETTCLCDSLGVSQVNSLYNRSQTKTATNSPLSNPQLYQFTASLKTVGTEFVAIWSSAGDLQASDIKNNLVIFNCMAGLFVFSILGFIFLWKSDESFQKQKKTTTAYRKAQDVKDFVNYLLPIELCRESWYVRFYKKVLEKNEYFVFFSASVDHSSLSRIEKFLMVIIMIVNFMFVHSVLATLIYPDDGHCEDFSTEVTCQEELSLTLIHPLCEWSSVDEVCTLFPPSDSPVDTFIFVSITAFVVVPLDFAAQKLVSKIMLKSEKWFKSRKQIQNGFIGEARDNNLSTVKQEVDSIVELGQEDAGYTKDFRFTKLTDQERASALEHSPINEKTGKQRLVVTNDRRDYVREYIQRTILLGMRIYRKMEVDKLTVKEEAAYVASNAKHMIVKHEKELSLLSSGSLRKEFLKHKLHLDDTGEFIQFSPHWLYVFISNLCSTPRGILEKSIQSTRYLSEEIIENLDMMNDDSDKNLYLCEHFIVANLPPILRHFASKHFFGRFSGLNGDSWSNRMWTTFALIFVPIYCVGAMFYIFLFGVSYGAVSTNTWLINVAVNIGMDIFIQQPMKIFIMDIVITGLFIKQIHALHTHLKARYFLILSRKEGLVTPGVDMVQHLNAACRAARYHSSATMSKVLMSMNDFDMPLLFHHEMDHDIWETIMHLFFVSALILLVIITTIIPEQMEDVVVETMVALVSPGFFMGMYVMGNISLPLPFILIVVVLVLIGIREIFKRRDALREEREAEGLEFDAKMLLKAPAYQSENYQTAFAGKKASRVFAGNNADKYLAEGNDEVCELDEHADSFAGNSQARAKPEGASKMQQVRVEPIDEEPRQEGPLLSPNRPYLPKLENARTEIGIRADGIRMGHHDSLDLDDDVKDALKYEVSDFEDTNEVNNPSDHNSHNSHHSHNSDSGAGAAPAEPAPVRHFIPKGSGGGQQGKMGPEFESFHDMVALDDDQERVGRYATK
jgi:hypothetical protein